MNKKAPPCPDGLLLVDKSSGMTSHDVVAEIRKIVRPLKVGHTGTLDPMATGLLPLAIGEATKLIRFLSKDRKSYLARVKLGIATDTLDSEGRVVCRERVPSLSEAAVRRCLSKFTGDLEQVPPMFSAIRHEGKRMYDLARKGIEIERKPRNISIEKLEMVQFSHDELSIAVTCSAGTYVRSLAADIAAELGTLGHLTSLERTACGDFHISDATGLENLDRQGLASLVLPLDRILERFRRVDISRDVSLKLEQGQQLGAESLRRHLDKVNGNPETVWFRSPDGGIIVVARVQAGFDNLPENMRILRVLRPGQPR